MTDLYRLLPEEMEKLVIDMGYQRYRADQILMPLYFKFPKSIADIKQLPKKMIAELVEAGYTIGSAKEIHRVTSEDGDTTKLLLNLTNDKSVETVLMQYESEKKTDFQDQQYVFLLRLVVQWDAHFVQQGRWALRQI